MNELLLVGVLIIILALYLAGRTSAQNDYDGIQDYLDKSASLRGNIERQAKPILWISIPYERNSRKWTDYGSRSTYSLNQPYIYLTMKTILQKCDKFHICIIDDNSFDKLIPEWNDNIRYQVPANERRLLGKLTLLYMYGGLCVPCSFLCMHDLFPIYESYCLEKGQWFLGEERNTGASSFNAVFQGNFEFMGAPKHDTSVNEFIGLLTNKRQVIFDNVDFDGEKSRWCQNLPVLDGKLIGTKDTNNEPVLVSELLSTHMISFDKRTYGVLIPAQEILTRTAYQWFARLSEKQVLKTNVTLGKLILLETTRSNAVGLAGMGKGEIEEDTINFWSLPKE